MAELHEIFRQFREITGLDFPTAKDILKMNNFNLQRAINYHLENNIEYADAGCSSSTTSSPTSNQHLPAGSDSAGASGSSSLQPPPPPVTDTNSAVSEGASLPDGDITTEDAIRAPIPPKREQLIMPDEDNFRFRKRRSAVFTVCPLRNFAREAEMQEQQLSWLMENRDANGRGPRHRPKRPRLDDLFCPPIDILFWGSFQAAREHATSQNRWLIVNLQDNTEFKSQILNRDIWSDQELRDIITKYFVLWQVSVDNAEGLRFKAFYHVNKMPYVCIIDPRTGEEKLSCDVVTPQVFRSDLLEFLNANLFSLESREQNVLNPYTAGPSTSRTTNTQKSPNTKSATPPSPTSILSSTSPSVPHVNSRCDYNQMAELSEEDQVAIAIQNSLKEKYATNSPKCKPPLSFDGAALNDPGSDNDLNEISDEENGTTTTSESYEKYLGNKSESLTKIVLRLSNGDRVQLNWSRTTKLRAIRLYVDSRYPDIAKGPYKLITAFPRQNILDLDDNLTLDEAKLHPNVVLHIHPDD